MHNQVHGIYLTDVPGYSVGHWTDNLGATGYTVVLCPPATIGGVHVCGGSPASREIATLNPSSLRSCVDAVLVTGGSVYGLSATDGVCRYLQEKVVINCCKERRIPIIPTVAIFDLRVGQGGEKPYADGAYRACVAASSDNRLRGSVGAGTGATVGKIRGIKWATKGGLGSSSYCLDNDLSIGALAVVNAFGDVRDPCSGKIIAGARDKDGFIDSIGFVKRKGTAYLDRRENTTICIVATNANLNKAEVNKVAQMASTGIAKVISPCWTEYDGDIVIALAAGEVKYDYNLVGIIAAELVAEAILDAVLSAKPLAGIPSSNAMVGEARKSTQ